MIMNRHFTKVIAVFPIHFAGTFAMLSMLLSHARATMNKHRSRPFTKDKLLYLCNRQQCADRLNCSLPGD